MPDTATAISAAENQTGVTTTTTTTTETSTPSDKNAIASPTTTTTSSPKNARTVSVGAAGQPYAKGRKERPCDACRRRKSRCVMNDGADKCVLCQFHTQECTFVQSPQPRKRRLAGGGSHSDENGGGGGGGGGGGKKRSRNASPNSPPRRNGSSSNAATSKSIRDAPPITDYSNHPNNSLYNTLGLQGNRHSHLIGSTAEYEPCLIDLCPFDSKDEYALSSLSRLSSFRRVNNEIAFTLYADEPTPNHCEIYEDLDRIERVVAPHGEKLVNLYFRIVHPSFPILHKRVFLEKYARTHREFAPPLLAAVYILALHWWTYDRELSPLKKPDVGALEKLAAKTMADVVHRPKLSTVQAGLLLLQRNDELRGSSWALTAQLVAIGQELGLHLDCTDWKIPRWEKGLRKRLAWGLFMQDKWGALTHGRPTHISKANWAVRGLELGDFPDSNPPVPGPDDDSAMGDEVKHEEDRSTEDEEEEEGSADVEKGRILFEQMILLSQLMAEVLETFFTVEAQSTFSGRGGTQKVLEHAKPIQLRLKEWFVKLPDCLRMEASTRSRRLSSTGYLHLAYFATEITLHRQILRTLSPPTEVDPYLLHICRSAAKTRLISAMDFVNRLKPEHLQSFWYFASKVNFALIGTFGSLLWATSPSIQEAEFYKARLSEYRWTLRVSSRGADFMEFAVGVLDASAGYLQQEQWRKRGIATQEPVPGYQSTVGCGGDNFLGLGMGVGSGVVDISAPPQPPSPQQRRDEQRRDEMMRREREEQQQRMVQQQLSPVTSDEEYDEMMTGDEEEEEEEEEMVEEMEGMEMEEEEADGGEGGSTTSSGARDFFMIPNSGTE